MLNQFVTSTFNELMREFKLSQDTCHLLIVNRSEFIDTMRNQRYSECGYTNEEIESLVEFDLLHFDGSRIFNTYDEDCGKIIYHIVIDSEWLLELENEPIDDVREYLTQTLRHEFGHILYDEHMFNKLGLEKGHKALQYSSRRAMNAHLKFYDCIDENDNLSLEEANRLLVSHYFSSKIERMANKFGNVDTRKLIKLTAKFRQAF